MRVDFGEASVARAEDGSRSAALLYTTTNIVAFYSLSPSDGERAGERGTLLRLLMLCI